MDVVCDAGASCVPEVRVETIADSNGDHRLGRLAPLAAILVFFLPFRLPTPCLFHASQMTRRSTWQTAMSKSSLSCLEPLAGFFFSTFLATVVLHPLEQTRRLFGSALRGIDRRAVILVPHADAFVALCVVDVVFVPSTAAGSRLLHIGHSLAVQVAVLVRGLMMVKKGVIVCQCSRRQMAC